MNYYLAQLFASVTRFVEAQAAVKATERRRDDSIAGLNDVTHLLKMQLIELMSTARFDHIVEVSTGLDKATMLFYVWIQREHPRRNSSEAEVMKLSLLDADAVQFVRNKLTEMGFTLQDQKIVESSVTQWFSIETSEGK